jgi:hypothetical protein
VLELVSLQDHVSSLAFPSGVTDLITDSAGVVLASNGEHSPALGKPLPQTFLIKAIRTRQTSAGEATDGTGREWLYAVNPARRVIESFRLLSA